MTIAVEPEREVAFALHDIHRQHVIHLDLKPSNVILRGNDSVLIDFGLSRHDQLPDLVQEETEGPVGTGAYVAPEQVHRIEQREAAVDLAWALINSPAFLFNR